MYILLTVVERHSYNYGVYGNDECDCSSSTTTVEPLAYFSTKEKADAFIDSCRIKGSKNFFKCASPLGQCDAYELKEVDILDPGTYHELP